MVCGLLDIIGVHVYTPDSMRKGDWINPKGRFEGPDTVALHQKSRDDWLAGKKDIGYYEEKYAGAILAIRDKGEKAPAWAFKTKLSIVLPVIEKYLDNVNIIATFRSPVGRALSVQKLSRAHGAIKDFTWCLKRTTNSYDILVDKLAEAKSPILFTSYEWMRKNAVAEANRMAEFLELPLPPEEKILEFIEPGYSTIEEKKEKIVFI